MADVIQQPAGATINTTPALRPSAYFMRTSVTC